MLCIGWDPWWRLLSFVSDSTLLDHLTDLIRARTGCLVVSKLKNYSERGIVFIVVSQSKPELAR